MFVGISLVELNLSKGGKDNVHHIHNLQKTGFIKVSFVFIAF